MQTRLTKSPDESRAAFGQLKEPEDVAELLEVPYSVLVYHLYRNPKANRYITFTVPKKSGDTRTIMAPASPLRILQRKLNSILQLVYSPKPSVHGFTLGKSVVTNAGKHAETKNVLNIDLEDFFPAINFGRVRGMFMAKPYSLPDKIATILAQVCCFQNQLPQGAPTSPIVSNMVCSRLDTRFQRLAQVYRCMYTRYADDITFSTTQNKFPHDLAFLDNSVLPPKLILGRKVLQAVSENGFRINAKKARLQLSHNRHVVTGLTANEFPNLPRQYVNQLRAMLHDWKSSGIQEAERRHYSFPHTKHRNPVRPLPSFGQVVRGKLNYLAMVRGQEDPMYVRFAKRLAEVDPDYKRVFDAKIEVHQDRTNPENAVWVLESEQPYAQGTGFMIEGVGLISCQHVVRARTHAFRTQALTKKYPIQIVSSDRDLDLAILQIDYPRPIGLSKGNSDTIHAGDAIRLLGFPNYSLGQTIQVFPGVVTGFKNRFGLRRIMISAPIVSGNSGGPVLNSRNEVIGVAATGADSLEEALWNEFGVIPINALELLDKHK